MLLFARAEFFCGIELLNRISHCRFVGAGGHRCEERRFLEFHHLDPKALGGEATVDTIELRCRRHNDYEGQLWFGKRRRSGQRHPGQVNWVQNQFD